MRSVLMPVARPVSRRVRFGPPRREQLTIRGRRQRATRVGPGRDVLRQSTRPTPKERTRPEERPLRSNRSARQWVHRRRHPCPGTPRAIPPATRPVVGGRTRLAVATRDFGPALRTTGPRIRSPVLATVGPAELADQWIHRPPEGNGPTIRSLGWLRSSPTTVDRR